MGAGKKVGVLSIFLLAFAPVSNANFFTWCGSVRVRLLGTKAGQVTKPNFQLVEFTGTEPDARIVALPEEIQRKGHWEEADLITSPYGSDAETKVVFNQIYREIPRAIRARNSVQDKGEYLRKATDIRQLNKTSLQIGVYIKEESLHDGTFTQKVDGAFFVIGGNYKDTKYWASPKLIELIQPAIEMMMAKREEVTQSYPATKDIKRGKYFISFVLDKPGTSRAADRPHNHEKSQLVSNVQLGDSRLSLIHI